MISDDFFLGVRRPESNEIKVKLPRDLLMRVRLTKMKSRRTITDIVTMALAEYLGPGSAKESATRPPGTSLPATQMIAAPEPASRHELPTEGDQVSVRHAPPWAGPDGVIPSSSASAGLL